MDLATPCATPLPARAPASRPAGRRVLELAFDQTHDAIVLCTPGEIVAHWNRGAERMFGWTADEVVGRHVRETYGRNLDARTFEAFSRQILESSVANHRSRRTHRDGRQIDVEISTTAVTERDGTLVGTLGVLRDVTGVVRAERAMRRLARSLERTVRERTADLESFSYSVSHDLRAPLRAISGFSRLLAETPACASDGDAIRLTARIGDAAARMGRMIDSLLEFSRIGRVDLHAAEIDNDLLVDSVFAELVAGGLAGTTEVRRGALPRTQADPMLARIVWQNLLANACKFSRGSVAPWVEIEATERGAMVAFSVRDNGVGFDPRYADRLFGVFERLHSEREFEGSGAGLSIVRRIVERHGGQVWADGAPNAGATLGFSLPAAARAT